MDWGIVEVGKWIGVFISGGALVALFNYLTEGKKLYIADKDDLIVKINQVLEKCEKDRDRLQSQIGHNQDEIKTLKEQLSALYAVRLDIRMPTWMTTLDHRYLNINDIAIQLIFAPLGLGREDVIGMTDEYLWTPRVCQELNQLDKRALSSPLKHAYKHELRFHKALPLFNFYKYVIQVDDPRHPIGFINYAIPCEMSEDVIREYLKLHEKDEDEDGGAVKK